MVEKNKIMKSFPVLLAFTALFLTPETLDAQTAADRKDKKMLVVYFSHSGNTRVVAEQIARATGADVFEIVPEKPYPTDYDTVVDQARKEIAAGVRPTLKNDMPDIGKYDVVFVGSPCWWATVAPPVTTFLASHDFAGKTVAPFMTHEGSRMGRSEADIRSLCPGAVVVGGLPVRGSSVRNAAPIVEEWLQKIKK